MKRLSLFLLASALAPVALAQPSPPAASGAPTPTASSSAQAPSEYFLTHAKELFRKGNALLQSNQHELALELFLQSRALVPGVGNTTNAAICLERLGRLDEAVGYYELALKEFSDRLTDEDRRSIGTALTALRRKVGLVDVAANVDGTLVIDGRKRGELPLQAPLRLMPGSHAIRVLKDGYAPAEALVEVKVGEEKAIDLRLEPLTSTGRLRVVDEAQGAELEVIVDGAPVGKAPWEGTLGVGKHLVLLQGKETGTAPVSAAVVAGQTVQILLRSVPIGAPLRLDPSPPTAVVALDDVVLGPGPWQGRLPLGTHQVRAVEEGYQPRSLAVDGDARGTIRVELAIEEGHPRWRKIESSKLLLEAHGGHGFASALGSDAERSCGGSCERTAGPGAILAGIRGAYLLPVGLAFEVGGGYLHASAELRRSVPGSAPAPGQNLHTYDLKDTLAVTGPYASLGLGYRRRLTPSVRLDARVTVGAHFASSRQEVGGAAARGAERAEITLERGGQAERAVNFFAMPEVGVSLLLGRFHASLGLGLALFLLDGPANAHGDLQVVDGPARCGGDGARLACVASDAAVSRERAYGPFQLWLPQLGVGYTF
jgi:hypothetical protein